ncbi:MAG: cytochrome b/b6 domain-containing protein [Pseudomonadota bacterium]
MSEDIVKTRVWDWTIRAFHWLLVIFVLAMWWTAEQGYMVWHKWLGVGFLSLLTYRLAWGAIGPNTARLLPLVPRPRALVAYLKTLKPGEHKRPFGHSPLGGLAVLALLSALWAQILTGLFAVDVNGLASGWFGHLISFDMGRDLADLHETIFDVLTVLIVLHLVAITTYGLILRTNLIGPMITGVQTRRETETAGPSVQVDWRRFFAALILSGACAAAIVWLGR